jgi:hypothetical protein
MDRQQSSKNNLYDESELSPGEEIIAMGLGAIATLGAFIVCAIVIHEQYTVKTDDQRKMTKKKDSTTGAIGIIGLIISFSLFICFSYGLYLSSKKLNK